MTWVIDAEGRIKRTGAGGGALPSAAQIGQVLFSVDGVTFDDELPLTDLAGWLVEEVNGILLVVDIV